MRIERSTLLLAIGVTALLAVLFKVEASEGQWLPEQIAGLDFQKLSSQGLTLTAEEIWNGEEGLLSAAVDINGCSSSFVSENGLIVTNHHCGFGAINSISTVENNYLHDGFIAESFEEEVPAEGYRVSFVTRYEDVTPQIEDAANLAGVDPGARYRAIQNMRNQLESEAKTETTSAIVVPYFNGRYWRRIWQTEFTDVRLVYAPPRDVGEFGGETDNWMWPRHTGDFMFFRAYCGPDGNPAAYSPDNVPYKPDHYLKVASKGIEEGDFVMIMGYPGRTNRYLSSIAVAARESYYYPMRRLVFGTIIDAYNRFAEESAENYLKVQSTVKSYSNVYKNAAGMIDGLARNRTVQKKYEEEVAFRSWLHEDEQRTAKYGSVLEELFSLDLEEYDRQEYDFVLDRLRIFFRSYPSGYPEVDTSTFELLVALADSLPSNQRIVGFDKWLAEQETAVDIAFDGLDIPLSPEGLMGNLREEVFAQRAFRDYIEGRRLDVGKRWIAAQEEWRGKDFYPDANSTLRVSMATVKPYSPRDGVKHITHTTVGGMLAKHTGEGEFNVPLEIRNAVQKDPSLNEINVCFLADGDTTGGNSGSPVVNGKGELVGLNFDRVYENVSGDFGWNASRSRNISVDIQYALWLMRDIWPAPRLLDEMEVN